MQCQSRNGGFLHFPIPSTSRNLCRVSCRLTMREQLSEDNVEIPLKQDQEQSTMYCDCKPPLELVESALNWLLVLLGIAKLHNISALCNPGIRENQVQHIQQINFLNYYYDYCKVLTSRTYTLLAFGIANFLRHN